MKPTIYRRILTGLILLSFLYLMLCPVYGNRTQFPIRIIDDMGHQIYVQKQPARIISLAPNMTEIVYAIGAGGRIVGVSDLCDYPPSVKKKPHVGDLQLRTEMVLALKPDLVLAHAGLQRGQIEELRRLGVKVAGFSPENWQELLKVIQKTGDLTGATTGAYRVIKNMEAYRTQVTQRIKGKPRVPVFVEVWNAPLMTAGPGTFLDQLITMAGGVNIAGKGHAAWSIFPQEIVLEKNPDVIILTCKNKSEVLTRRGWNQISAIRSKRVYEVEPDIYSRPGPRLGEALEDLAALLHPEP